MPIGNGETVLRVLIAALVGLLFGLDREKAGKPAGVRTFVLVCLSSCVIAIVSAYGYGSVTAAYSGVFNLNTDPARLMVGVLTGIGFLGAGIIWRSPRGDVSGVTTAAAIFTVAALGLCCGLGLYLLLAVSGAIAFLVLLSEHKFWRTLLKKEDDRTREKANHATWE